MKTPVWYQCIICCFILCGFSTYTIAQNQSADDLEELFFQDVPQVVSATRLRQSRLESPVAVTVIDRLMIDASGFTEIADLLRLVPGFQVAHVDGRRFAPTYHGSSSEFPTRLQVLINGRSIYHAILSSVNWNALGVHIDNIDRIEVIRGPNAPAFGSNAFLGTVNIITKEPFLNHGLQASMNLGNFNFKEITTRFGAQAGLLDFNITANFLEHDGMREKDDWRKLGMLNFQGSMQSSPSSKFLLYLGQRSGDTGADGYDSPLAERPIRIRETNVEYQQFKWIKNFNRSDLNFQIYHNRNKESDEFEVGPISKFTGLSPEEFYNTYGIVDQSLMSAYYFGETERYDVELENAWNFSGGHDFVMGMGYRLDEISSKYYFGHSNTLSEKSSRIFANGAIKVSKSVKLNLGLIFEDSNLTKTHYSPRVGLNWFLSPTHMLRVSTTMAHRYPSLLERNMNYTANLNDGTVFDHLGVTEEELKPEKITSKEIGYAGNFPNQHLHIEIKAFKEDISNIIAWPRKYGYSDFLQDGAISIRSNGELSTTGIEGQISWKPNQTEFISLQYSNSRAKGQVLDRVDPPRYENLSPTVPRNTLSLLGLKSLGESWSVGLGYYYYSKMRWLGEGGSVDAYDRIDLNIKKTWKFHTKNLSMVFGAQNIGEKTFQFELYNLFEPRYYFRLEYKNN